MTMSDHMRIDVILDRPLLEQVRAIAKSSGISGHTVLPALGGEGVGGLWSEDLVTGAQSKLVFMVVTSEAKARRFVEALEPLLDSHGLVALCSSVAVLRSRKFD